MIKKIIYSAIISVIISNFSFLSHSYAQVSSGCLVQQASQAALQRRLAEIDATKTNVDSFFSGSTSCVNPDLFNSIDLSSMIPDLGGLLNGGLTQIAQNVLNNAKNQVCSIVQQQIQRTINNLNSTLGFYQSSIGAEMTMILGKNNPIGTPNVPNFGNYDLSNIIPNNPITSRSLTITPSVQPIPPTNSNVSPTNSNSLKDIYQ